MKDVQVKESIMGVKVDRKNLSPAITVWYHLASLVMPDYDPHDSFFYLILTPVIDPYNPIPKWANRKAKRGRTNTKTRNQSLYRNKSKHIGNKKSTVPHRNINLS